MQSVFQVGKCLFFITWMFLRIIFLSLEMCGYTRSSLFVGLFFNPPLLLLQPKTRKNRSQRLWRRPELMVLKPTLTLIVNPGMVA